MQVYVTFGNTRLFKAGIYMKKISKRSTTVRAAWSNDVAGTEQRLESHRRLK